MLTWDVVNTVMSTLKTLANEEAVSTILEKYEISSKLELELGILSSELNFHLNDLVEAKPGESISISEKDSVSDVLNVMETFDELHQKIDLEDLPEKVLNKIKDLMDLISIDEIRKWVIRKVHENIAELGKTLNQFEILTYGKITIGPEFDLKGIKIIMKLTNEFKMKEKTA